MIGMRERVALYGGRFTAGSRPGGRFTVTAELPCAPETAATRIIVLTVFDLDSSVFSALRAGVSGFLLKDVSPGELLHAIRVVAAGESLPAPSVTRRLIEEFCWRPDPTCPCPPRHEPRRVDGLTSREHEVLTLVALGRFNTEIAREPHISPTTVKTHVASLFRELDVRDRAQLVIFGYRHGIVEPGGVTGAALRGDHGHMLEFNEDNGSYEWWITAHPEQFVIDAEHTLPLDGMVLHRATCRQISGAPPAGTRWIGDRVKICGTRRELEQRYPTARPCGRCLR